MVVFGRTDLLGGGVDGLECLAVDGLDELVVDEAVEGEPCQPAPRFSDPVRICGTYSPVGCSHLKPLGAVIVDLRDMITGVWNFL